MDREKLIKETALNFIKTMQGMIDIISYYELDEKGLDALIKNDRVREALIRDFIYTRKNIR